MKIKVSGKRSLGVWLSTSLLTLSAAGGILDSVGTDHAWQKLTSNEDNFSIDVPVQPRVSVRGEYKLGAELEHVKQERIASAYYNGVVYIIRLFESSDPKRLLSKYPKFFQLTGAEEGAVAVGGIEGKQYQKKGDGYVHLVRLFPAKKYLYVIEAAARAESNPDVQRFFSSLTLGTSRPTQVDSSSDGPVPGSVPMAPSSINDKPLSENEVTRPAIIIYKPWPRSYPALAKAQRVKGVVKLRAVLSPTGEVTDLEVIKGLGGGLTEEALKVAPMLIFLPAEKNGRPVAQYAEVEYKFILK